MAEINDYLDLGERIHRGLAKPADYARNLADNDQVSSTEYASDQLQCVAEDLSYEAGHIAVDMAKGAVRNVRRVHKRIQEYHSPKIQPCTGNIRAVQKADVAARQAAQKTIKASQRAVKASQEATKASIKTAQETARATKETARMAAVTARKTGELLREGAKAAAEATKAAAKAIAAAAKAVAATIEEVVEAIAAGGWVVLVILAVIIVIFVIIMALFGYWETLPIVS